MGASTVQTYRYPRGTSARTLGRARMTDITADTKSAYMTKMGSIELGGQYE